MPSTGTVTGQQTPHRTNHIGAHKHAAADKCHGDQPRDNYRAANVFHRSRRPSQKRIFPSSAHDHIYFSEEAAGVLLIGAS